MNEASGTGPLPEGDLTLLRQAATGTAEAVVEFCRDLIRQPSPSGDEEAVARRTAAELNRLGIEQVGVDRAGNVIATLPANHPDPLPGAVLLDAHLDHVDVGDASAWSHDPFGAELSGGRLWGRGSTDTKSAVAAQVHAMGLLHQLGEQGLKRRRDLVLAAVVQEEVGGLGTACFLDDAPPLHAAIIGEPSEGGLSYGHRGRVEIELEFIGRAAHAARPDRALSPHPSLARFVQALPGIDRDDDAQLGASSVAPTLIHATPNSPNVIPGKLRLILDWRNVPGERPEDILQRVLTMAEEAAEDGVTVKVQTSSRPLVSWSGLERGVPRVAGAFGIDQSSPLFQGARSALEQGLGRSVRTLAWDFASDAGWLQQAGVPCIGHGPGDMAQMHVLDESVSVELLREAPLSTALLVLGLDRDTEAATP